MSLYDSASLAMIPSGIKDGKLYSAKPINGAGDFTFTRGANLAATRVDENGLIEKGRENLLLHSNQFDTTWTNVSSSETGGQAGYDGSTDAWKLDISSTPAFIAQSISLSNLQTLSFYAKAGTLNFCRIYSATGPNSYADFDLVNGTVGTTNLCIDTNIESIGNGWYRCSITFSANTSAIRIYPIQADNDLTATSGNIYIQDAQLEVGLVATDYIPSSKNLLLQSNKFNTTWAPSSVTATGGQTGYDSTSDAWLLSKSASDGYIYQDISYSGVQSLSVYAKSNTLDGLQIYVNAPSVSYQNFNLQDGILASNSNVISSNIQNIGNGWYRCSMVFNSSITRVRLYPATKTGDKSGTSGSIYIQDAQLELGSTATTYDETTTGTSKAGILENLPRLDYTDSSCPSLLLEPTRTNIITHSEYFADSSWSKSINPSIFSTSEVSPDGSTGNVYRFSASNANVFVSPTTGVQYTISFYVKSNGAGKDKFKLRLGSNESSDITATNEWVRHSYTATADSAVAGIKTAFSPDNEVDILIYGAQLEAGSYPTSYIPTYGTSVTRSVDSCSVLNVASLIGQSEGTILFDAKFQDADRVNFSLSDSTANNHITIDTSSSYSVFARIVAGGVTQAEISTITSYFSNGDTLKCAVAYAANDFAFYINGTQIGVDASGTIPLCDDIKFARYNGSINAYQNVNKVLLFKSRLSNTELIALTTI